MLAIYKIRVNYDGLDIGIAAEVIPDKRLYLIVEFFRANPDIMLYMCDNANDQQAQRNRLFLRWFTSAEPSKLFYIKTAVVVDEGMENFIAIIVPRQHPYLEAIIERVDTEVQLVNDNK